MCGRTRFHVAAQEVERVGRARFDVPENSLWEHREDYRPSYNVGPGFVLPVIRRAEHNAHAEKGASTSVPSSASARGLLSAKWGLISSHQKPTEKPNYFNAFNARSETVAEKPLFSRLLGHRRCVVLAQGFYEWRQEGISGKVPYHVLPKHADPEAEAEAESDDVMAFAGLWDEWTTADGGKEATFTILTTDAPSWLTWLHDRAPVALLTKEAVDTWLSGEPLSGGALERLSCPYGPEPCFQWFPVTQQMNKVSFQSAECARPVKKRTIESFFRKPPATDRDGGEGGAGPSTAPAIAVREAIKGEERTEEEKVVVVETEAPMAFNADATTPMKRAREEGESEGQGQPSAKKVAAGSSPSQGTLGSRKGSAAGKGKEAVPKGVRPLTAFFPPSAGAKEGRMRS